MKARERDGIERSESHTGPVARQRQGEARETTSGIYTTVQVVDEARTDCRQTARPEAWDTGNGTRPRVTPSEVGQREEGGSRSNCHLLNIHCTPGSELQMPQRIFCHRILQIKTTYE